MMRRMAIAVLSLVTGLVALYLHLFKKGLIGNLSCSTGGCETAMFSPWGSFFGLDVALVGVIGYTLLLGSSLLSLQPRWAHEKWPVLLTLLLAVGGFLFTLRLKYGEFIELKTFCPWCAISATAITVILILAFLEWRSVRKKVG